MSFSTTDTIVAIVTPPGRGGIGIVRLSGPSARHIAAELTSEAPLEPRYATLATVRQRDRQAVDQALVTYFPAPHSYTGEDVIEISAHGSPVILRAIVSAAMDAGARLAEPGEFTLRAFLNGRVDLVEAEAVADLIDSVTPLQARAAFDQLQGTLTEAIGRIDRTLFDLIARLEASVDFPDEGYHFIERDSLRSSIEGLREQTSTLLLDARRGRMLREGLVVAIVGKANVGKSSLFNALVGSARAIVTDIAGTTRDFITEPVDLCGLQVTLVDTAGLRDPADGVEAEGISRARRSQGMADLTLLVLDSSQPLDEIDLVEISQLVDNKSLIVANKIDLSPAWSDVIFECVRVSATTNTGLDLLRAEILRVLGLGEAAERPGITNIRHIALVQDAHNALTRASDALDRSEGALPEEFILADLQQARGALEEICGRRATEDLLEQIFSRFCIGK